MKQTTEPETSLTLNKGAYLLSVEARKSRIRIEKKVPIFTDGRFSGAYETRPVSIPMTRILVCLQHTCGDVLSFLYTAMGKKISVTRSSTLLLAKVVNKTAFGPDMLDVGGKPESWTLDKAVATISRMIGIEPIEARRFFDYQALMAMA